LLARLRKSFIQVSRASSSCDASQDSGDFPTQLKDSWGLLDVGYIADLAVELNELNTELQGKNTTTIQMTGVPLILSEGK
jgi:hypothetical protein